MKFAMKLTAVAMAAVLALPATAADDIVDTAVGAGKFKTLATALQAADLVGALKGDGPFTVFAPTDDAFGKLPDGTVASLVKPENKETLAGILTYHVVPGKVMAADVVKLSGATTLNGQRVDISVEDGKVMVDGAQVVTTDIECSNGVIHVIDSVITPASETIVELGAANEDFSTLVAAVKAAGLAETLSSKGPFTVLAPTNEAFAKLPKGTVETLLSNEREISVGYLLPGTGPSGAPHKRYPTLISRPILKPENKAKLVEILKYHVLAGRVYSDTVTTVDSATTLQGSDVKVSVSDAGVMLNGAKVLETDIDGSNGVIHVIDSVLLPPEDGDDVGANVDPAAAIESAIVQGAKLFNQGHHAACADVYRNAMTELMSTEAGATYKSHMTSVLQSANAHTCPTQQAWTLRHGMDQMYLQIVSNR